MKDETKNNMHISPLELQAYFDGAISEKEQYDWIEENLSDEDNLRLEAYEEMRDLLRFDSEQALEPYDPDLLWARIQNEVAEHEKSQPSDATATGAIASYFSTNGRWLFPTAAITLLALLAVTSFLLMFNKANDNPHLGAPEHATYVFVDSQNLSPNAVSHTANNTPVIWFDGNNNAIEHTLVNEPRSQLTIQELDAAINYLIQRIENLEERNGAPHNAGNRPLDTDGLGLGQPQSNF